MTDFPAFTGPSAPAPDRWEFFAPPQFAALPPAHQDQFRFLDEASTAAAYEAYSHVVCGDDWGTDPFARGCYATVERLALRDLPPGRDAALKKWLYQRGVPFRQEVLVLPVFGGPTTPAVVTTWKMVVTYAEAFFSMDNTAITNAAAGWCLYFHHDDVFHFGRGAMHHRTQTDE